MRDSFSAIWNIFVILYSSCKRKTVLRDLFIFYVYGIKNGRKFFSNFFYLHPIWAFQNKEKKWKKKIFDLSRMNVEEYYGPKEKNEVNEKKKKRWKKLDKFARLKSENRSLWMSSSFLSFFGPFWKSPSEKRAINIKVNAVLIFFLCLWSTVTVPLSSWKMVLVS